MQAPMSRFEQDVYINDRYAAMEDRLSVKLRPQGDVDSYGCAWGLTFDVTAGSAQKAEQAYDSCGKGGT